jgi:hypothetical protein
MEDGLPRLVETQTCYFTRQPRNCGFGTAICVSYMFSSFAVGYSWQVSQAMTSIHMHLKMHPGTFASLLSIKRCLPSINRRVAH